MLFSQKYEVGNIDEQDIVIKVSHPTLLYIFIYI